jgi:hypothetical protein
MVEPGDLYSLNAEATDGLGEPVLLVAMDGYVDAGNGVRIAVNHLLQGAELNGEGTGTGDTDVVVRFDADLLTDYRSRRPSLTYTDGAFTDYDGLDLVIRRLTDTAGTPYLLLTGPEPDLLWERFTTAIVDLVHRLNIRLVVGLMAIPMAVPHTRPAGMSKHSGQPGLVQSSEAFLGTMQVPGHVAGLIEYRLGELGLNAIGLAAHVPHYLSRSDYPVTAQHLLRTVGELTGLHLDPEGLNAAIGTFDTELASELAGNTEVAEVVQALERQYDTFVAATGRGLLAESEPLPTADELGAQIEAFLADQDPHTN